MNNETIIQFISDVAHKKDPDTGETISNSLYTDTGLLRALRDLIFTMEDVVRKATESTSMPDDIKRQELKKYRMARAAKERIPAYCIFNDKCLEALLAANIKDKTDLLGIYGIGQARYEKYGDELFGILSRDYENEKADVLTPILPESDYETEALRAEMIAMLQSEQQETDENSCKNCRLNINETCTKIRKELCEEYERGAGFTPEEIRKGYHGGNEGDASRFRKQKKKK